MNKKTIIKILSEQTKVPKNRVDRILTALENIILTALQQGEIVNFTGFLKFYTKQRNERKFVNFQTGESFIAPQKLVPAVKFSAKFINKL